jgi:3-phenylpropionate/trans-cinnamate dioxygenase ferredoxin reductase component
VSTREVSYLLVGGGLASGSCAVALREAGAKGDVLLVGREPDPPYDRPPLSKEYLRGEASREDAYLKSVSWYEENAVELALHTSVVSLDAGQRVATLSNKEEVRFEKALLATGANVRILRVSGAQLDGIHYLRTFANSDSIRQDVEAAGHVVLVGGSYIGTEVAASLTAKGLGCTILMQEDVTLERAFGAEVGRWFQDRLTEHGVEIVGGDELGGFEGAERVEAVTTASGRRIECGAVVIGAGVHPDVHLAEKAGLAVDNGITCDSRLQTSVPGIFAAGDVCSYESVLHGRRLRVEHWDVALNQGKAAARGMMGEVEDFAEVPYFFSDLADWASLEYVGPASEWDEIVWRGDREGEEWSAWYLKDGKVAAALSVGRSEDLMQARRFISEGTDVTASRDALADPDSDLESI